MTKTFLLMALVATPLHEVPPFLSPTPEEREIFGKVRHYDYYTTIVSAEGLPEDGFFLLQPHASEPGWEGRSVAVHQRYPGDVEVLLTRGTALGKLGRTAEAAAKSRSAGSATRRCAAPAGAGRRG